jgi:spore coat protein U-like protein
MKKILTLFTAVLCAFCLITPVSASVVGDNKQTTVNYAVTEAYEWDIHAEIDFGSNAGVGQTIERTIDSDNATASVSVTGARIADGKCIDITIDSANNFHVVNGSTQLAYTVKKSAAGSALADGDSVLVLNAGAAGGSQSLIFTLSTGSSAGEVAGTYVDTITYTAVIRNQ